jgi:hypothetical protein
MTARFVIKVKGKDKHVNYTDNVYAQNSRSVLIKVLDKDGESFDGKKGASSGKSDVTVEAGWTEKGDHYVVKSIKHPEDNKTYYISDDDLPKKKP